MRHSWSNCISDVGNDIDCSECANKEEKDACVKIEKSNAVATATAEENDSDSNKDYTDGDGNGDYVVFTETASKGAKQMQYTAQQNQRWDEIFQQLLLYKNEYKSTCVPLRFKGDQEFGE